MNGYDVVGIFRIQNKYSWLSYERESKHLKAKYGYWSPEPALWHGTKETDPKKIIYGGFDVDHSRVGIAGKGVYFSKDA